MTEVKRESLSALIDGEASEIEVHRLVREFRSDDSLIESWAIYQQVRATAQFSTPETRLTPQAHQDLLGRISDAIDNEQPHQDEVQKSSPAKMVMGSLALAASLVVTVFIGMQQNPGQQHSPQLAGGSQTLVTVQTVANTSSAEGVTQTSELVELDEEKQRQLRAYLNQHDRMARMNSDKRFVNYQKEKQN